MSRSFRMLEAWTFTMPDKKVTDNISWRFTTEQVLELFDQSDFQYGIIADDDLDDN